MIWKELRVSVTSPVIKKSAVIVLRWLCLTTFGIACSCQTSMGDAAGTVRNSDRPEAPVSVLKVGVENVPLAAVENEIAGLRYFDESKLEEYRADADFKYDREEAGRGLLEAFGKWLSDIIPDVNIPSFVFYIFLYGLIAFAVIMILLSVFKEGVSSIVFSKQVIQNVAFTVLEDPESSTEWDKLIGEAVESGNYRLAVRFLYLLSLQQLALSGVVILKKDKTNHQYLNEIQIEQQRNLFGHMTRIYEHVWFGEFDVHPRDYNRVLEHHEQLVNSLN